ncbi:MAG: hypothetical protein IJ991_07210 [Thermoguttaceae bacterium]|nr:hypothetical protein [Thermoguttaceae bacterium]
MARTVNQAFEEFMRDSVNLDSKIVVAARASRDNLLDNIAEFSGKDGFFALYDGFNQHFGSFARRTKCRELDDIDLMIGIAAIGATYDGCAPWDNIRIWASPLDKAQKDCQNSDGTLNSRMVLNRFKERLSKLKEYSRSELHRNKEAVRLNLKSKDWSFDIVPCFYTDTNYYLIPNGEGNWKKTDPRIDKQIITESNQRLDERLLELIRLCKKWNKVKHATTIPSYLLETLLVDFARSKSRLDECLAVRFTDTLNYIMKHIDFPVFDMKNIQQDINFLTSKVKEQIKEKAYQDWGKACEAGIHQRSGDHRQAILRWREIFGEEFPRYDG